MHWVFIGLLTFFTATVNASFLEDEGGDNVLSSVPNIASDSKDLHHLHQGPDGGLYGIWKQGAQQTLVGFDPQSKQARWGVALDPTFNRPNPPYALDRRYLYIMDEPKCLDILDPRTGEQQGALPLPKGLQHFGVTLSGTIFMLCAEGENLMLSGQRVDEKDGAFPKITTFFRTGLGLLKKIRHAEISQECWTCMTDERIGVARANGHITQFLRDNARAWTLAEDYLFYVDARDPYRLLNLWSDLQIPQKTIRILHLPYPMGANCIVTPKADRLFFTTDCGPYGDGLRLVALDLNALARQSTWGEWVWELLGFHRAILSSTTVGACLKLSLSSDGSKLCIETPRPMVMDTSTGQVIALDRGLNI